MYKKSLLLSLVLILSLVFVSCSSDKSSSGAGETVVLKVATVITDLESPENSALAAFEKNVEERTDGRIDVQFFPAAQLGVEMDTYDMVRSGNIQVMIVNSSQIVNSIEEFAPFNQYYVFDSLEHFYNFCQGEGGKMLLDSFKRMGIIGYGFMPQGFRQLSNSARPIVQVDDIEGIKIRGYNQIQMAAWESVGAVVSTVAWTELFQSMQQNLIDGQECSAVLFDQERFYEVQDFLTLTDHQITSNILIANGSFMDSLPEDLRTIIEEEFQIACDTQNVLLEEQTKTSLKRVQEEYGVIVNELLLETLESMKALMIPASKAEVKKQCSPEIYENFLAFVEASRLY